MNENPEWMSEGFCRTSGLDPDLWFPSPGSFKEANEAKRMCRTACPVREQCAEYAINFPVRLGGIWGGLSYRDVRKVRQARGITGQTEAALSGLPRDWGER